MLRVDVQNHASPLEGVDNYLDRGWVGGEANAGPDHVVVMDPDVLNRIGLSGPGADDQGRSRNGHQERA